MKKTFFFLSLSLSLSWLLSISNICFAVSKSNNQHIPVFLAADDNYAPYVATTIASVLQNTKAYVDFYVLSNNISKTNQTKIKNTKKFFPNNDFSVQFYEVDMKNFQHFNDKGWGYITQTAYTRWLIPMLYPHINKAIYLDDDIIVKGDIAELYNEELNGKIMGAVPDMADISNGSQRHNLLKKYGTFVNKYVWNSGVYLVDCEKWRQNDITNQLIATKQHIVDYHKQNNLKLTSCDQDTSNMVLQDIKVLPLKYNTHPWAIQKCLNDSSCNVLFNNTAKDLQNNAFIIHYVSSEKPWKNKQSILAKEFWNIVSLTDFATDIHEAYNNYKVEQITQNLQTIHKDNQTMYKKINLLYIAIGILIMINLIMLCVFIKKQK